MLIIFLYVLFDLDVHYTYDKSLMCKRTTNYYRILDAKYFWSSERILYGFIKDFDNRKFLGESMQWTFQFVKLMISSKSQ